jgi:predicted transcriptional regulator
VPHFMPHLSADDWFEGKLKIEYGEENLTDLPHQEILRKREEKIMKIITAYRDRGIPHLQLARIARMDRKNLTSYMTRLKSKGLVIRGKGKQGKYFPATKIYRGTILTADLFTKAALGIILADEDLPVASPFFRKILTDKPLEYVLMMFSNKLGAIITYFLIHSMDPANKIMGDTKDDEEKDLNVQRWIDDAISCLGPYLLPIFKEHVIPIITSYSDDYINSNGSIDFNRAGSDLLKHIYDRPLYTLNERFISQLMAALSKSYPTITNGLEKIRSQLPRAVDKQVSRWEYEANCFKQQKICTHDYKIPSNKSLSKKNDSNILHCRKCHKNKYKKSPFLKRL